MKVLILSTQATGASMFAYFLGQGDKTVSLVDCFIPLVPETVPPGVEHMVVKQNVHPDDTVKVDERIASFKPNRVFLFVRHPADIWTSLQTRDFKDFGGSPEDKLIQLDALVASGKYTVLKNEDFVGNHNLFAMAVSGCLPGFGLSLKNYDLARPYNDIINFNTKAGFEFFRDYATGGIRVGKIQAAKPRNVPKDVMAWICRNCPSLMTMYDEARSFTAANPRRRKYTFHYVAAVHLPVVREYSACAYTQKIHKLTRMLLANGHTVKLYGVGRTDITHPNLEFVQVLPMSDIRAQWGDKDYDPNDEVGYNWRAECFRHDLGVGTIAPVTLKFMERATEEIRKRADDDHFLLLPLGGYQKSISAALKMPLTVEPGVGYTGVIGPFIAYESAYIQNWVSGHCTRGDVPDGRYYDRVIPNYFDVEDFPFVAKPDEYFIFMGRMIERKGFRMAYQVAKAFGMPIKMVGQGGLPKDMQGDPLVTYMPAVSPKERAELLGHACVSFVPTVYMEPFGGVSVEAMMCGTPVLTTDFGAFPEINKNGVSGYCCRTFDQFVRRAADAIKLDRAKVREHAIRNFCMEVVSERYEEWWDSLYRWHLGNVGYQGGWWNVARETNWHIAQVQEHFWRNRPENLNTERQRQPVILDGMGISRDYPDLDLKGKRILEIGGGFTSLLTHCKNYTGAVVDPGFEYEKEEPYAGTGIKVIAQSCEDMEEQDWDEVWVTNVLRNVSNPAEAARRILKAGKVVRVWEVVEPRDRRIGNKSLFGMSMSDYRLLYRNPGKEVDIPWKEGNCAYVAVINAGP